MNMVMID